MLWAVPPGRFWIRRPLDADADDAQQRLLLPVVKRGVDAARLGRPLPVRGPLEEAHDAPLGLALGDGQKVPKYTKQYAKDNARFFSDFAAAFQKLEENGCTMARRRRSSTQA